MSEVEKALLDQSYLVVNWLTTFIVLQSLAFCYALGKGDRFSNMLNNKKILLGTIVGMILVLISSLFIVSISFISIKDLLCDTKSEAVNFSINLQLWVRIIAVTIYGIIPVALLYFTKIRKLYVHDNMKLNKID